MEFIIVAILLLVIFFIYGMLVRKKVYKDVDRLEAWKIDIMNRPVTDEMSLMKGLNMVGQTEQLFEKWRTEWDEIITTELPNVEEALFDIEEYADKYRIRKAKLLVKEINDQLQGIEDTIKSILSELQELVGSEENNKVEIEELKQDYRDLKRKILAHSNSFGKAEVKLELMLEGIVVQFESFYEKMDNGDILLAKELVQSIKDQIDHIKLLIEELPALLKDCSLTIPNQIDELLQGVKEMTEEGFVLNHLQVEKEVSSMKGKLTEYLIYIENADIEPVKAGLIELQEQIEGFYDQLEKEVISKHFVQQQVTPIHVDLSQLNDETKETKIEAEQVQLSYKLLDKDLEMQKDIETQINTLLKRFTNVKGSIEEQDIAYSVIQSELEDIKGQIDTLKQSHQEFVDMLQTLRKDEMYVKEKLGEMRKMLLDSKRLVQKSNLPGLPEGYLFEIKECNNQVVMVAEKLQEKPLHVPALTSLLEQALAKVELLSSKTEEMVEQAFLVEQVIQYGNRYRGRSLHMAEKLAEAELAFRNFEYPRALEEAATALERVEPGALKKVQNLIENN
ncbi:septation ring formation regulator [Bacillus mesophilus]|uniref:Septation ring formation regulator EzrA n=1 Tax=Bacillus mesophilus TaxID=1808955 RepID=A0A6M0Q6J6_9BACI|nr:septation ring formation regulator EzrA [Bacillus mesophilus]MBM7660524.1 septation ring formation regulator [Bacillus mesophilus]NEY71927.1 septation ring formation regulator EzrA [Bacillus mesophilus]